MAMRFPMHRKLALRLRPPKRLETELVRYPRRTKPPASPRGAERRPCHHRRRRPWPARSAYPCRHRSARPPEPAGRARSPWQRHGRISPVPPSRHRCPSRQTLRTTGTSRATWTRIRSARLPAAISPWLVATRFGGVFCYRTDGRGKIDRRHPLWQLQRRHQQARGNVVGRQDVQQPLAGLIDRGDVAGMRTAAHHVGGAHQDADAGPVQTARGLHGGGGFATETRSPIASVTFSSVVSSWLASGIWY